MNELDVKSISLLGMEFQRTRLEAAATNIANAQVFSSSENNAFKPLVAQIDLTSKAQNGFLTKDALVTLVENDKQKAKAVFKPEHPLANDSGYVFAPAINLANEMISLNAATRAYEANVKAFNAYKEMSAKALNIGK